jgi:hypothetical protein
MPGMAIAGLLEKGMPWSLYRLAPDPGTMMLGREGGASLYCGGKAIVAM